MSKYITHSSLYFASGQNGVTKYYAALIGPTQAMVNKSVTFYLSLSSSNPVLQLLCVYSPYVYMCNP